MEGFYRMATAIILLGGFGASAYFRTRANLRGGKLRSREGAGPLLLMRLIGLGLWLPLIGYLINPEWVAQLRVNLPDGVRLGALLVLILNSALTIWMLVSLGTNITPVQETREHATLVTHGPYRYIRHPLYTFGFTLLFGLTALTGLWSLLLGALAFMVFILWRTPREEAKLIEVFGEAYQDYMRRTGRFFPKLV